MSKPTNEVAASAAPDWAIQIWCDLAQIYIQLPSAQGPVVLNYPRDAHGLSDVLNLMKTRHAQEGLGQTFFPPPPLIKQDPRFTPKQRDVVRDLLRKKGIIGRP